MKILSDIKPVRGAKLVGDRLYKRMMKESYFAEYTHTQPLTLHHPKVTKLFLKKTITFKINGFIGDTFSVGKWEIIHIYLKMNCDDILIYDYDIHD